MNEEERDFQDEWLRQHPQPEQDENGIDLTHLRENLRRTPSQRLEKLERVLEDLHALRAS
jgi:hypothetical protein